MSNRKGRGGIITAQEQLIYYGWRVEDNGCWTWLGPVNGYGYGVFRADSRRYVAHRVASNAPDGLLACHRCDNRRCVNPEHIFFGTHKDNTADMLAKGRGRWQKEEQ